ncbi:hypothetical protein, partial [Tenacibaculum maritimum]|uniref:hypothetical protein n=2 Tax=Tenacibaculum maritimum TaxID=107401 RepID=UPI0038764708
KHFTSHYLQENLLMKIIRSLRLHWMNEGYFKQVSEPIKAMQNGVQKTIDGIPVYYVDFVELVKPL